MRYSFILIFCFVWINLIAQDDIALESPKVDRHQVGLNVVSFLDRFNKTTIDSLNDNLVYDLVYRFFLTNRIAVSTGIGGKIKKTQEKYDVFSDVTSIEQRKLDVNVAIEYHWTLSNRWKSFIGANGLFGYTGFKSGLDSGFDQVIKSKEKSYYGSALRLGIQYHILKRLSVGTEVGMTYIISTEKSKTYFDNFIDFNGPEQIKTGLDTYYFGPTSLYLNYKF